MEHRKTYRQTLWEIATGQHGLVTTHDARQHGIPAKELPKLAQHGAFKNVGHGVYRFEDMPADPRAAYCEAVLCAGPEAYLTGDAVLSFFDLGLVNPPRIRVGVPHRTRRHLPERIEVVTEERPPEAVTVYDGIPMLAVADALLECKGMVMKDRLQEAAAEARQRGLLTRREYERVRAGL